MESDIDSRQMCFSQGKPCVYQPPGEPDWIVTEWPNGVIERLRLSTRRVTRTWPDGRTETIDQSDPSMRSVPLLPGQGSG